MSGHYDELIGGALDEFRHAEALEGIPAGGSAAVRAKAARRRRARVTTYGVLGALLIAIPVTAFAANPRGNNGPPIAQRFGDGRFRAGELVDAPAPAFDDPACGRQIAGQISNGDRKVYVKEVAHANLDSDPEPETAALLVCMLGNESTRVAAYDRGPDGKPVSLGAVVGRLGENDVVGIRPRAAGGITATVHLSTHIPELGAPEPQDRDFAWDGSKFVQVGGPTAFVRAKAELSLTAAPLQLGPEQNGRRSGMVTLTLRNDGPEDSLSIDIALTNNHRVSVDAHVGNVIRQQPLKAGESRTITLNVGIEAGSGMTPLSIGAGLHSYAEEANLADNSVQIEVVS